jgi:hypothetical protein
MTNVQMRNLKQSIWQRLTVDPAKLRLDAKVNEQPADCFVRLAFSGKHADVSKAVRALLVEVIAGEAGDDGDTTVRFLYNALPLCDSIGAEECKPVLRNILLVDDPQMWGGHADEVQELAARALVGLKKERADIRFWRDLAGKLNACLPYALNAAIEIDVGEGVRLVCETYALCEKAQKREIVDWATVFALATERHGVAAVSDAVRKCCVRSDNSAAVQDFIAYAVAEQPELSRRGKLDLDEIARLPHAQVSTTSELFDLVQGYGKAFSRYPRKKLNEVATIYREGSFRILSDAPDYFGANWHQPQASC